MVGQLCNPRNILVRISKEDDFISVMARGNLEIHGVPFWLSHWTSDFMEEEDSPWVLVWVTLPGLPLNYFQVSMLSSIGNGFGRYLKRDNTMMCVTHPEVAQTCVEIDVSKPLRNSFWLGPLGMVVSHFQKVISDLIPLFCMCCRKQGHLESNCLRKDQNSWD